EKPTLRRCRINSNAPEFPDSWISAQVVKDFLTARPSRTPAALAEKRAGKFMRLLVGRSRCRHQSAGYWARDLCNQVSGFLHSHWGRLLIVQKHRADRQLLPCGLLQREFS